MLGGVDPSVEVGLKSNLLRLALPNSAPATHAYTPGTLSLAHGGHIPNGEADGSVGNAHGRSYFHKAGSGVEAG